MPYPSTSLYPSTTLYPAVERINLMPVPSSETGSSLWISTNGTNAFSTALAHSGSQSLLLTKNGSSGTMQVAYGTDPSVATPNAQAISVTAGKSYTFSYWVRTPANGVGSHASIMWQTNTAFVSQDTASDTSLALGTWERRSITATAPSTATKASLQLYATGIPATGLVYVDDVLFEQSSSLGNYFDGSTVNSGYVYSWSGTANNSTSSETAAAGAAPISSALSGSGTFTAHLERTLVTTLSGSGTITSNLTNYQKISSALSGSGTLSSGLGRTIATTLSGSGTLASEITNYHQFAAALSGSGTLASVLSGYQEIASALSGSGTLVSALTHYQKITSALSGSGTLTSNLVRTIHSALSGSGTLTSRLSNYRRIASALGSEGVLYTELGYVYRPPLLTQQHLGKLSDFSVSTSGVPVNPAKGSGSVPSISATYVAGTDPEYALGEDNSLHNGAIGTWEGEIVRLTLATNSGRAAVSMDTPLTRLNIDAHLFPFIDGVPGTWTAVRAIDYWTQQCGLFYDKVPGKCVAYASGYGHTLAYGAGQTANFYEKLAGGATSTTVLNNRSVKSFGSSVTGTTAFHDAPATAPVTVPLSMPKNHKGLFSIGLGLRGTGRTATTTWNFLGKKKDVHTVSISATSAGAVTATVDGLTVDTASVTAGAEYRVTLSLEIMSTTAVVGKLTVHTDDLAGTGAPVHTGLATTISLALPGVLNLTSIVHASTGGSGAEMLRWGTYLSVDDAHPTQLSTVQKVLGQTLKNFAFVSGFTGNVWTLLNEFCFFSRMEVRFTDKMMHIEQQDTALTPPGGTWSAFSATSERRDKSKQVAVKNRQSKAVTTGDGVLWKADSVFQVAAREIFQTTVQTDHSILAVVNPTPVSGITPFPYKQGTGQYVVTGADGYIVAPAWWNDNGGKVEVSLTDKEGEIAIKITAPAIDTVRAPYRISEGAGDRPALYISGSGIINTPKDVVVSTGASSAKEGHDSVYESPFIAGTVETYDAAVAMAAEYSASSAELSFELPNDFDTPTGLGQAPVGRIVTDNKRNYRILDVTQTKSRVSGTALAHTTIGAYVASYPAGATVADEVARHAGKTIRQFNIKPLRRSDENS